MTPPKENACACVCTSASHQKGEGIAMDSKEISIAEAHSAGYTRIDLEAKTPDISVEKSIGAAVAQIANNLSDILADCIIHAQVAQQSHILEALIPNITAILEDKNNKLSGVDTSRIKNLLAQCKKLLIQKWEPKAVELAKQTLHHYIPLYNAAARKASEPQYSEDQKVKGHFIKLTERENSPFFRSELTPRKFFEAERDKRLNQLFGNKGAGSKAPEKPNVESYPKPETQHQPQPSTQSGRGDRKQKPVTTRERVVINPQSSKPPKPTDHYHPHHDLFALGGEDGVKLVDNSPESVANVELLRRTVHEVNSQVGES